MLPQKFLKMYSKYAGSSPGIFLGFEESTLKDQVTVPSESLCNTASILQTDVPPRPLLLWQLSLICHFAQEVPQKASKKGRCFLFVGVQGV